MTDYKSIHVRPDNYKWLMNQKHLYRVSSIDAVIDEFRERLKKYPSQRKAGDQDGE